MYFSWNLFAKVLLLDLKLPGGTGNPGDPVIPRLLSIIFSIAMASNLL